MKGVRATVYADGMSRAPVLAFDTDEQALFVLNLFLSK
jgi:hydroxymethylglutaryl-CoA reductase